MSNKPKDQHYIPRVYLKNFQIDNDENKSFVWCFDFSNKYNQKPQRLGLNDKVFKIKNFYTHSRFSNPYIIEEVLSQGFEPNYEKIMQFIREEKPLEPWVVQDLMAWLFISKLRSPYLRSNSEYLMHRITDIKTKLQKRQLTDDEKIKVDESIKILSKQYHINAFADKEQVERLMELHFETLNCKHWRILKSLQSFPFWTNDNPGYSINTNPLFAKETPFHRVMELNASSIIYYVLSPEYCLEIKPFTKDSPLEELAINMEIKYEQASPQQIQYINEGVFYTRYKLIISNKKELLDYFIRIPEPSKS